MRTAMLFNFLVESTLIGSVLILLMLPLRLARRRLGSRVIWSVWLLAALRLLTPLALPNPLLNLLSPLMGQDAGIRPMAEQVRSHLTDAALTLEAGAGASLAEAARGGQLGQVALCFYLGGAALCAVGLLAARRRFRQRIGASLGGALTAQEAAIWQEVCQALALRRLPRVQKTTLGGACMMGIIRPVVLLPEGLSPEAFRRAALREACHVKGLDPLWIALRNLCCLVHWFNPLVWLAACCARTDCELACDERAAALGDVQAEPPAAEAGRTMPGLGAASTCMALSSRAQRLRQAGRTQAAHPAALAALCLGCAIALSLMFATAELHASAEPSPTLTEQAAAEEFAQAFLQSSGVDAGSFRGTMLVTRTVEGWRMEQYLKGENQPCVLTFSDTGVMRDYRCLSAQAEGTPDGPMSPVEERTWCTYLMAFLRRCQPDLATSCARLTPGGSSTDGTGRYLTIRLLDAQGEDIGKAVYQLAPKQRLVCLTAAL